MSRRVIFDTSIMIASERGQVHLRSVIGDDDPVIAAITAMELLIGIEGATGRTLLTADAKAGVAELPGIKAEVVNIP